VLRDMNRLTRSATSTQTS